MNERLLGNRELVARFRAIRQAKRMSAQQVAERSGIPRETLTKLENGRRASLTIDEAKVIADALNVDLIQCLQPEPVVAVPAVTV